MKYLMTLIFIIAFAFGSDKKDFDFLVDKNLKTINIKNYLNEIKSNDITENKQLNSSITKLDLILFSMNLKMNKVEEYFSRLINFNKFIIPKINKVIPTYILHNKVTYHKEYKRIFSINDITIYGQPIKPLKNLCENIIEGLSYKTYENNSIIFDTLDLPFYQSSNEEETPNLIKDNTSIIVHLMVKSTEKTSFISCLKNHKKNKTIFFNKKILN